MYFVHIAFPSTEFINESVVPGVDTLNNIKVYNIYIFNNYIKSSILIFVNHYEYIL